MGTILVFSAGYVPYPYLGCMCKFKKDSCYTWGPVLKYRRCHVRSHYTFQKVLRKTGFNVFFSQLHLSNTQWNAKHCFCGRTSNYQLLTFVHTIQNEFSLIHQILMKKLLYDFCLTPMAWECTWTLKKIQTVFHLFSGRWNGVLWIRILTSFMSIISLWISTCRPIS